MNTVDYVYEVRLIGGEPMIYKKITAQQNLKGGKSHYSEAQLIQQLEKNNIEAVYDKKKLNENDNFWLHFSPIFAQFGPFLGSCLAPFWVSACRPHFWGPCLGYIFWAPFLGSIFWGPFLGPMFEPRFLKNCF